MQIMCHHDPQFKYISDHLRLHLVISSQFLRELEFQLAQCLNERHGLDVADGATKFDHACVTSVEHTESIG